MKKFVLVTHSSVSALTTKVWVVNEVSSYPSYLADTMRLCSGCSKKLRGVGVVRTPFSASKLKKVELRGAPVTSAISKTTAARHRVGAGEV